MGQASIRERISLERKAFDLSHVAKDTKRLVRDSGLREMYILEPVEVSQLSYSEIRYVVRIPAVEALNPRQAANHSEALVGSLRVLEKDLPQARQPSQDLLDGIRDLLVIFPSTAGGLVIDHVHFDDRMKHVQTSAIQEPLRHP